MRPMRCMRRPASCSKQRTEPKQSRKHREPHTALDHEQAAPVGRDRVRLCQWHALRTSVCKAPAFALRPLPVDLWERGPGASGRGSGVAAYLQARKRPGLRKEPGLFVFTLQPRSAAWQLTCSDRWIAPPGNGRRGCSLTTQREATPKLVGTIASHFADVAQLVARELAMFEATGSSPVVRSISGVPVHKHWAGSVCMCAGAAAPVCSEWPGLPGASRADTAEMESSSPL